MYNTDIIETNEHMQEWMKWLEESTSKYADGDKKEYAEDVLRSWGRFSHSSLSWFDDNMFMDILKKAIKEQDFDTMYACFLCMHKGKLLWHSQSGYDHCDVFYNFLAHLSYANYEDIFRAFPDNLPISTNGYNMLVYGTNLILYMLYPDKYDKDNTITKAEKYVASKAAKGDRALISVLLGIIKKDVQMISDNLQIMCSTHARTDLIYQTEKVQCCQAYGLLKIAYHMLTKEEFDKIELPNYKTFDKGYLYWLLAGGFSEKLIIEYKHPYEIFNVALLAPIPITKVIQPYLDTNKAELKRYRKSYMDINKMNLELVDYVMKTCRFE